MTDQSIPDADSTTAPARREDILRAALEWYADPQNWFGQNSSGHRWHVSGDGSLERRQARPGVIDDRPPLAGPHFFPDCGSRARSALDALASVAPTPAPAASSALQTPPTLEGMAKRAAQWVRRTYSIGLSPFDARGLVSYALTGMDCGPERDAAVAAAPSRSPAVAQGVPAGVVRDYLAAVNEYTASRGRPERREGDDREKWTLMLRARAALDAALSPDTVGYTP